MATETYYVRNRSTGRIHRVVITDGARLSSERCNLDDARYLDTIAIDAARATIGSGGLWCRHCCRGKDPQALLDLA